jgi:hypothetical protein
MPERLLSRIGARWPRGFYLPFLEAVLGRLFAWSPGTLLNRRVQSALKDKHTPAWVSEAYCLAWIALELTLVALQSPAWPRAIALGCLFVLSLRLLDTLAFALHWIFVAKGQLESYRRSLVSFLLNLCEVALVATLLFHTSGCLGRDASIWTTLYSQLGNVFRISLASEGAASPYCAIVAHGQLVTAWTLLLIVITVVVSGITRGELRREAPPGAG